MDKANGQEVHRHSPPGRRTAASAETRERLLVAAAELIGELGWGRVTTRGVAERAGLPHGAVSYHFNKRELLIEAAMHAFEAAVPRDHFEEQATVVSMLELIDAEVGDPAAIDRGLSRLMLEAMREAERDEQLRERLGRLLEGYRALMVEAVGRDQSRGVVRADIPAEAIATTLGALGDGLLLHALLDPGLDTKAAIGALRALLLRP